MNLQKSGNRYVITDIHGCAKTFKKLLKKINLTKQDTLYLLGDYIDRGPDSKGVIDLILKLQKDGYKVHTLKGNHEDMLLAAMYKEMYFRSWLSNGGKEALESFDVNHPKSLDSKYIEFFNKLKYYIELEDFYLVHAGFNFNIDNPLDDKQAMLWIRNYEPTEEFLKEKKIVHGHTPIRKKKIKKKLSKGDQLINLDAGCAYVNKSGMGRLCALNLDTMELTFQKNKWDY